MHSLVESEQNIAKKFLHHQIKDSFTILGAHLADQNTIVRAYLNEGQIWRLVDSNTGTPILTDIIYYKDGFHSWLVKTTLPGRYKFENNNPDYLISLFDPYNFDKILTDETAYLWNKAKLYEAWKDLGVNYCTINGISGYIFRVWAPAARKVSVVGDFNQWNPLFHGMRFIETTGIWEIFIPLEIEGSNYKYQIFTDQGHIKLKADPYAKRMEHPPNNASVVVKDINIEWEDESWIKDRKKNQALNKPLSIFEVHLGSWMKKDRRFLSYYEMESELVEYVKKMNFTHVEMMPVNEYPLDASWGYQPIGMYAPSIRFGSAKEFKYLVNAFHKAGIGVILDWVPAHFPADAHGLAKFDGSCLYEYEDLRKGYHPDWNTLIFNFARNEVINYLISNAFYWIAEYHIDGFRVDAVSSMLYLNYSREEGQWEPNIHGGNENLEAISFIKTLNKELHKNFEGVITIAEEATSWPGVSSTLEKGGLGFDYKWNMGWMHDSLRYAKSEPYQKTDLHHVLTHCIDYAFDENYILPLSHDEVVHGKSPMIGKLPGLDEHKFRLLKAYYSYMWAHPGKKLLFMGNEFAQRKEWNFEEQLEWFLLQYTPHLGVQNLIKALNHLHINTPALFNNDNEYKSFRWIKKNDANESVFAFLREDIENHQKIMCVANFSNNDYINQKIGTPINQTHEIVLHSCDTSFGGFLTCHGQQIKADNNSWDGFYHSISFDLPALSCIYLKLSETKT